MEMKRIFYTLSCCLFPIFAYGQVIIMDNTPVNEEVAIEPYDSLSNFELKQHGNESDYYHLKGQTIIYCGWPYSKQNNEMFKVGDSYFIKDIKPQGISFGLFVLQNTTTKNVYKKEFMTHENECWVVKGHLDKLRKLYVGNEYLYVGKKDADKLDCLISLKNHQPNRDIKYHSKWKCIDIQVKPRNANDNMIQDRRSPVVIVFDNPEYGKYYCYYEDTWGSSRNYLTPEIPPLFELNKTTKKQSKDARIGMSSDTYANKYGKPDGKGLTFINGCRYIEWYYGDTCVVIRDDSVIDIRKK